MKTKTLSGCSYFVTFIDDHSRKVWVYTLKTKYQVLDVFKQFHTLVERQTGKKLKCIRSDNEGEYIGPFDAYCREHGIQHQKTSPKTPQLNGLAKRMNRTLVGRGRCLLSHARVWSGKDVLYHHLRVFGFETLSTMNVAHVYVGVCDNHRILTCTYVIIKRMARWRILRFNKFDLNGLSSVGINLDLEKLGWVEIESLESKQGGLIASA
ncbi:putative RNA-directed DNA polymerase [Tanacetum coccineum]